MTVTAFAAAGTQQRQMRKTPASRHAQLTSSLVSAAVARMSLSPAAAASHTGPRWCAPGTLLRSVC